ncbi:MAG: phosphatase PAP2 family protein [Candidatus Aenigmarchaeota archaeon]|nr:phosphatase PAP2 family protein [Candidatus Aenigmarchaeota archaeon]
MFSFDLAALYYLNGISKEFHIAANILSWSAYLLILIVPYLKYRENPGKGITAALSIGLAVIAAEIIKQVTQIPRPYATLPGLAVTETSAGMSFPSRHTAVAFAASESKPRYTNLFRIWAVLIGISRIVLAQHYITEVIAGAILGVFICRIIAKQDINNFFKRFKKNQFEIKRQAVHMLIGTLLAYAIYFFEKTTVIAFLIGIVAIGYLLSKIAKKTRIPVIDWILDHVERKKDSKKFPGKGVFFFNLGALISIILYGKDIAFMAVLVLAVGDAATTIGGKLFGKTKHIHSKRKTLEGSGFGMITAFLALFFLTPMGAFNSFLVAIVFGIVESFIIKIGTYEIDDNLVIPIVCGLLISVL